MSKLASIELKQTNLLEHPAVRAWRALRPKCVEPEWLEVLQEESPTTGVYRLVRVGTAGTAVIAKRCRQNTALIERTLYEEILPNLPLPMLHYYGSVEEPNGEFCWLFLEDLSGDEKYQPHLKEHRVAAARWLGIMNTSASALVAALPSSPPHFLPPSGGDRGGESKAYKAAACLPERGPEHYLNLLRSARDTILSNFGNPTLKADDLALLKTILAHCEHLSRHWSQLAGVCEGMPQTLVHGDFIKKNVGVRTGRVEAPGSEGRSANRDGLILLPFDWEKAGWGVPAEDISRVDIPTYWSTVQDHWPKLSIQVLERLANVGKIFRCLVFLDWLAPSLETESVEQPMNDLRRCETWLADLIQQGSKGAGEQE